MITPSLLALTLAALPVAAAAQDASAPAPPAPAAHVTLQTPYDPNNILARQISGQLPSAKVYEDRYVLAVIVDKAGHFIVMSKASRARNFLEVDPQTYARMSAAVQKVARAEIDALGADVFLVRTTAGTQSGIAQLHIHGFPTYDGAAPITAISKLPLSELELVAARIRAAVR